MLKVRRKRGDLITVLMFLKHSDNESNDQLFKIKKNREIKGHNKKLCKKKCEEIIR